ncbi:metallophosphoesterase family protein [uncultured Desulfovibrio sp.]|uniref:metallophosphoesterase family protein n=1 Tax=uncultured Desulfovibrio sp. TaxID=167968 RepID=UPI002601AE97|nr:metallophosphoesterase family protein [uncultured Desulfovibrio sp.]
MRLGILADAHGNLAGLRSCLHFLQQQSVDHYLFLGDATGYFPQNAAVCELLTALPLTLIAGNHEGMLMGELPMSDTMKEVIRPPETNNTTVGHWLQRCAQTGPIYDLEVGGKRLRLVHGSPDDPWSGHIDHLAVSYTEGCDVLLSGHTHRPCINNLSTGQLYVNPGSCGYPRDNGAWLSLAVLDTTDLHAQIFRLPNRIDIGTLQWLHPAVRKTLQRKFPVMGTIVEAS